MEEQARQAAKGMWLLPTFAVQSPLYLDQAVDGFQMAQGVGVTGSRDYLNFGQGWRDDFTIMI